MEYNNKPVHSHQETLHYARDIQYRDCLSAEFLEFIRNTNSYEYIHITVSNGTVYCDCSDSV